MRVVNKQWYNKQTSTFIETGKLDIVIDFNKALDAIVKYLTEIKQPYKIYNLGSSVKRLTTETDTCPCCRRKL